MVNIEKFHVRKYSKQMGTNKYAAPMHGVKRMPYWQKEPYGFLLCNK